MFASRNDVIDIAARALSFQVHTECLFEVLAEQDVIPRQHLREAAERAEVRLEALAKDAYRTRKDKDTSKLKATAAEDAYLRYSAMPWYPST